MSKIADFLLRKQAKGSHKELFVPAECLVGECSRAKGVRAVLQRIRAPESPANGPKAPPIDSLKAEKTPHGKRGAVLIPFCTRRTFALPGRLDGRNNPPDFAKQAV